MLCTFCRKCDPARTVDYTKAAKSPELDVDFPDRLSGDDEFSSDDESGDFVGGVSKRLDSRRRACHRRLCKLIFSTTWCLSLQVIAFSALAAFFVFPVAGVTNDFCGVASIVTSDISKLGLLPEQAEAGVGACFGNGSLLSALGLGESLDFATQVGGVAGEVDNADLSALFAEPLALMSAFNESAAAMAVQGDAPGLGNVTAMLEDIAALEALASCIVPTSGAFVGLLLPAGCPYTTPPVGFTRGNIETPWVALGDADPQSDPQTYMASKFNAAGTDPAPQAAWNNAIVTAQFPLALGAVQVQDSVQRVLNTVAANISAVLEETRAFETALGAVQSDLIAVSESAVTTFTTQAALFVTNSQCSFVAGSFALLQHDVCDDMLNASFVRAVPCLLSCRRVAYHATCLAVRAPRRQNCPRAAPVTHARSISHAFTCCCAMCPTIHVATGNRDVPRASRTRSLAPRWFRSRADNATQSDATRKEASSGDCRHS